MSGFKVIAILSHREPTGDIELARWAVITGKGDTQELEHNAVAYCHRQHVAWVGFVVENHPRMVLEVSPYRCTKDILAPVRWYWE